MIGAHWERVSPARWETTQVGAEMHPIEAMALEIDGDTAVFYLRCAPAVDLPALLADTYGE